MLRIGSRKWHYRLYRLYKHLWTESPLVIPDLIRGRERMPLYRPRSLCTYFWFLVLTTLFGWLAALVFMVIVGLIALAFCIIVGVKWLFRPLRRVSLAPKEPREFEKIEWIAEYLAAKKRRVCPLLEVVNQDKSDERRFQ